MPNESTKGPILAIIIIIVLLIVGGAFVFTNRLNEVDTTNDDTSITDPQTSAFQQQSTSTDLNSIEADVKATDLTNLDAELKTVSEEVK